MIAEAEQKKYLRSQIQNLSVVRPSVRPSIVADSHLVNVASVCQRVVEPVFVSDWSVGSLNDSDLLKRGLATEP